MTNYLFWPVWFLMWVGMVMGMYYQTMEMDHNMKLLLFGVAITLISYIYASNAAKEIKKDNNGKP